MIETILEWFESTNIHEQIIEVDFTGLFTNPWFMVPFCCVGLWMLYKQSFKELIIIAVIIGAWWFSGTDYMAGLVVNGELQVSKVLPVTFGGAAALGFVIYLLFGRSD